MWWRASPFRAGPWGNSWSPRGKGRWKQLIKLSDVCMDCHRGSGVYRWDKQVGRKAENSSLATCFLFGALKGAVTSCCDYSQVSPSPMAVKGVPRFPSVLQRRKELRVLAHQLTGDVGKGGGGRVTPARMNRVYACEAESFRMGCRGRMFGATARASSATVRAKVRRSEPGGSPGLPRSWERTHASSRTTNFINWPVQEPCQFSHLPVGDSKSPKSCGRTPSFPLCVISRLYKLPCS